MRFRSTLLPLVLLSMAVCGRGDEPVDRKADRLMREMSTLLEDTPRFSFAASEIRDVVDREGKTSQLEIDHRTFVERPNRVRREVSIGDDAALLIYNEGSLGLHSTRQSFYALADIPTTIDPALDYLDERLDVRAPIADMLYSSPYESYVGDSTTGQYLGKETVGGASCHHLAFQHPAIDFEIWLADGERPLPCKLLLSYKLDEGAPKSVLTFRDWDLAPEFEPDVFAYNPPEGYVRIPFLGLEGGLTSAPEAAPGTN